jgi:hypothetical protein
MISTAINTSRNRRPSSRAFPLFILSAHFGDWGLRSDEPHGGSRRKGENGQEKEAMVLSADHNILVVLECGARGCGDDD